MFAWPSSLSRKRWAPTPSTHSLQSSSSHTAHCVEPRMHAQMASVDRMSVATSLSVSAVRDRQSRTCDEVTHVGDFSLQGVFTRIHRTVSDFKPAIAVSRITFHFALVEIDTNFKTGLSTRPDQNASRPLPKSTPTGKLHPVNASTSTSEPALPLSA